MGIPGRGAAGGLWEGAPLPGARRGPSGLRPPRRTVGAMRPLVAGGRGGWLFIRSPHPLPSPDQLSPQPRSPMERVWLRYTLSLLNE